MKMMNRKMKMFMCAMRMMKLNLRMTQGTDTELVDIIKRKKWHVEELRFI